MRSFFTGFNRPDGSGWLGFHDGVSNIRVSERLKRIQIDKRNLNPAKKGISLHSPQYGKKLITLGLLYQSMLYLNALRIFRYIIARKVSIVYGDSTADKGN